MSLSVTSRDIVLMVLAVVVVLLYVAVAGWGFPLDDSWIHQTYGRNLGVHGEWAFRLGEPSAASTSPLYTVLLAIGYFLRVPYIVWTHGLGVLALGFTAIIGARLAENITENQRVGWVTGLALVLTWHLIWAAAAGMETMLFGLLTMLLMSRAWHETEISASSPRADIQHGVIFGVLVALTTLARPEGIILGGLVAVLMLLVDWRRALIWGFGAAVGFGVMIAPYLLLNYQLTGGLLPNTAAAKFEQHALLLSLPYYERFWRLLLQIIAGGQVLLLPGVLLFMVIITRRRLWFAWLPVLWIVALIGLYAARLPAAYQHGRYVMPALPALTVAGVIGTYWILQAIGGKQSAIKRIILQVVTLSIALLYIGFAILGSTIYRVDVAIINGEMVTAAEWIADNLPEDELLAIHDIGAVGYFAPRPMLDIAGLVSPDLVSIVADEDALWHEMETRRAVYLMAFPDQIPGRNANDPRLCEIYSTDAPITQQVGHPNMKIYRLAYNATCAE